MITGKKAAAILLALLVLTAIITLNLKGKDTTDKINPENINPGIHSQSNKVEAEAETISFFAEYRMERERMRSKQIELLREVINQNQQGKARESASLRLVSISEDMEKEMKAENLVKSRGYHECVVIIQRNVATVVIQAKSLSEEQENEIKSLVASSINQEDKQISIIVRK